jgi:hypothetical protein
MKAALLACIVLAVLVGTSMLAAQATILPAPMVASRDVIRPHWVHTGMGYSASHRRVRIFDRRKLGMLCVMPPDMQVALDWPGPACAYTDNFIFVPHQHRYRIK